MRNSKLIQISQRHPSNVWILVDYKRALPYYFLTFGFCFSEIFLMMMVVDIILMETRAQIKGAACPQIGEHRFNDEKQLTII